MPVQPVGDAPELLVDEEPLEHRPALAAVLDGVASAVQPPRERLLADHRDPLGGQPPAEALRLELERHQHLLDELAGAGAQLALPAGQPIFAGGRGGGHPRSPSRVSLARSAAVARAALPESPSSRLWWLADHGDRGLAGADDVRIGRLRPILRERQRPAQVGEPRAQPRAHDDPLDALALALDGARRRASAGLERRNGGGQQTLGLGGHRQPVLRARPRSPAHPCRLTSTDYKVRIEPMAIAPASADTPPRLPAAPRSPPGTTSIHSSSRSSTSASSSAPGSSPGTSPAARAPAPT